MIPRSIKVGRRKYNVHVGPAKRFKRAYGYIDYRPGDIYIHTVARKRSVSPSNMQETFWHETTHAILYEMGHTLHRNEAFVTQFSKLLNQAIRSAKL